MNRYDFVYLFDVKDANPNGDPDAGNLPRIDPETGEGLVTDVCLKRKIRNFIQTTHQDNPNCQIFIQEKRPLNPLIAESCKAKNVPDYNKGPGKWDTRKAKNRTQEEIRGLQKWLCERYFDIRAFGGVLSTGPNAGQIRGPVQIAFSRSIDPIVSLEHTITRVTDVDKEEGEIGRKFTISYALYRTHGFVNPFLADQTGFSGEDLDLIWEALKNAFQFDQSAARPAGSMAPRKLIVFKHDKPLGSAPSHKLFDLVTIEHKDESKPARAFDDYIVNISSEEIPTGVELIEMI